MKLEHIPLNYDNEEQEALDLLNATNPKLGKVMENYIEELLADIHMRDSYIRSIEKELDKYVGVEKYVTKHLETIDAQALHPILEYLKTVRRPWDMCSDSLDREDRFYLYNAKFNQ